MPVTDLLRTAAPPAPRDRPPGITCEHYAPGQGKRCASYVDGGACARPDEFMCSEWLKHNADRTAASSLPPACPSTPTLREGALLSREDAESFRRLGVELEITSPLGTFWLVPDRTGKDRLELAPEDVVAIVNVVRIFGGQIVSFSREGRPLPDIDPKADAREHLRRLHDQVAPRTDDPQPQRKTPPAQTSLFDQDGAR